MSTATAMTPDQARSIIAESIKFDAYEGDVPEDDEKAISEAEDLVSLARDAREAGIESEAVTNVLFLAEVDGGSPSDPNVDDEDASEGPWDGYDGQKVSQIIKTLDFHKDSPEKLAEVWEYETANKNRVTLLKALEDIANGGNGASSESQEAPSHGEDEGQDEASEEAADEGGADREEGEEEAQDDPAERDAGSDEQGQEGAGTQSQAAQETGYDPEHHELVKVVTDRIDEERLSVPAKLPEQRLEMPFDLTELSDTQIRRMHSAFNAYSSRAAYVLMLEEQLETACRHVADNKVAGVMVSIPKINPETNKPKTATELKAEAEQDEVAALWRDRQRTHGRLADAMRKERDIYDKNVQVLSREWTMRHEELEHSGQLPNRRK